MRIMLKSMVASVGAILGAGITYYLVVFPGLSLVERFRIGGAAQSIVAWTGLATAILVAVLVFCGLWRVVSGHGVTQGNEDASSFRTAKRWAIRFCKIQLVLLPVLTYPYWGEALKGRFYNATRLSIYMYGVVFVLTVILFGLLSRITRPPAVLSRLLLFLACVPLGGVALKWGLVVVVGLTLFHNEMGLGMEIFGSLPNMFIDGCLFLAALAIAVSVWRLTGLSRRECR